MNNNKYVQTKKIRFTNSYTTAQEAKKANFSKQIWAYWSYFTAGSTATNPYFIAFSTQAEMNLIKDNTLLKESKKR